MKPKNRTTGLLKLSRFYLMIACAFWISSLGCNPPTESPPTEVTKIDTRPPTLIKVSISPEARVKAAAEDIAMKLTQGEWHDFSIEIDNAAGITAPLAIESEQFSADLDDSSRDRWLQIQMEPDGPLSGLRKETRNLRLRSRDSGVRTAILNFNAGQGTQDLGFRSDVMVTFKIQN